MNEIQMFPCFWTQIKKTLNFRETPQIRKHHKTSFYSLTTTQCVYLNTTHETVVDIVTVMFYQVKYHFKAVSLQILFL